MVGNVNIQTYLSRPLPLTHAQSTRDASVLTLPGPEFFSESNHPEAAWSGLLLRAGCWEESHEVSQNIATAEGSYWHGIAHRMEPDDFNAGYWFRRVSRHSIFPSLHAQASEILAATSLDWELAPAWDPAQFIDWCAEARSHPNSEAENAVLRIQEAEWRLLFHFCTLH